jgi:AcrR family transcriptional regulator
VADATERTSGLAPKGRRTRKRILEGARRAFEHRGNYVDTRITDITKEAGVAYGSLYTYFDSKEMLFRELALEVVNGMYSGATSIYRGPDPIKRVESANRRFMNSYRDNAQMMAVIEQVASLYPDFHLLRRQLRQRFVERIRSNIERWQASGLADPDVDSHTAAHALVSMTDNFGYLWFVLEEPFDEQTALRTLTQLWVRALRLRSLGSDSDASDNMALADV